MEKGQTQNFWGFPGSSDSKESACNVGDSGLIPGFWKIPWGRKWQPTPVFLPGKSHGQRSLAGYSPWGHKESEMTEQLILSYPLLILSIKKSSVWRGKDCTEASSGSWE